MELTPEIKAVRFVDALLDVLVFTLLVVLIAIGAYCVWDNKTIEDAASAAEWEVYKPTHDGIEQFEELMKMNPDVVGWIDVYGTNIDYPVLYSAEPDEYLMKNPKGEFSLTGSIFIDADCASNFSDLQTIIYGHHMDRKIMFGPIDDFEDDSFFSEHRYGKITLKDGIEKGLDIWMLIKADAYDHKLYRRGISEYSDEANYLSYISSLAVNTRDESIVSPSDQIILLSTCAGDSTNGRNILIAKLTNNVPEDPFYEDPFVGDGSGSEIPTLLGVPWYAWGVGIVALSASTMVLKIFRVKRHRARISDVYAKLVGNGEPEN